MSMKYRIFKSLIAVLLTLTNSQMSFGAFNATAIWRTSTVIGSDTAAGGAFDPGVSSPGTDESQGAGTSVSIVATATTGVSTPAFSATTHGPGNFIQITGGTGTCTNGVYELKTQSSGTGTFDKTMGTGTCTGVIGGPFASIGAAAAQTVAGNNVCIKADGTYSISANITITVGGSAVAPIVYQGYISTCGVGGTASDGGMALVQESSTLTGMFTISANGIQLANLVIDGNSQTGTSRGINITTGANGGTVLTNLVIKNYATNGILTSVGAQTFNNIRITGGLSGCTGALEMTGGTLNAWTLVADTNSCPGVDLVAIAGFICKSCIIANNSGATVDGVLDAIASVIDIRDFTGSAIYGNGRDGYRATGAGGGALSFHNDWFWGNAGKSINITTSLTQGFQFDYNAYPAASLTGLTGGPHDVTLTADPSVAGATLNFALNSTAGGGAAIKTAGFPGVLGAGGTGFLAIGPLQPNATGGQVGYPIQ
jgi:hypothetical protein